MQLCNKPWLDKCFALYAQLENYSFNTQKGSTEAEAVAMQCKLRTRYESPSLDMVAKIVLCYFAASAEAQCISTSLYIQW